MKVLKITFLLHYYFAAPPDPVASLNLDVSDNSVTLSWVTGFQGSSPITHFEIEVFQGHVLIQGPLKFASSRRLATVANLEPSNEYMFIVYAVNTIGHSDPNIVHSSTLHFGEFYPSLCSLGACMYIS